MKYRQYITSDFQVVPSRTETVRSNNDIKMMWLICEYSSESPLCNNRKLYENLKKISNDKKVSFGLMVGISYAEWHIGANRANKKCTITHNRGGIKWKVYENNTKSLPYYKTKTRVRWCDLYTFWSVEEYRESKANSLYHWYIQRWAVSVWDIAKRYVKGNWILDGKQSWIKRVSIFIF